MMELDEMIPRGVYRLRGRNLDIGVWDGENWIGVREKFGDEFLDRSEVPGRTCTAESFVGMLPDEIETVTGWSKCQECETPTDFDRTRGETWQERCFHVNGDTSHDARSAHFQNVPLFRHLKALS